MINQLSSQDHALIQQLQLNARASVTDLAKALHLSRTTVQQRLQRLEEKKAILGYTVRVANEVEKNIIKAHVMIKTDDYNSKLICDQLAKIPQVDTLLSISGRYDLIAMLSVSDTQQLEAVLDSMWEITGIVDTESSVVLSTRLDRR
ncbi:MAG TPA: AsnC family transcriptional regulator [Oceanospirillaceae bacterium]|nr:AsnC family transcriptional regulator [Oceanospirillaceae bacterium]